MWTVYRIEMPARTRAEYLERGSADMRGYAASLVLVGGEACSKLLTFDEQSDAIDFARAEFDRSGRSCIVRRAATEAAKARQG